MRKSLTQILVAMILLIFVSDVVHGAAVPKLQLQGFEYMKAKNYSKALECYSAALKEKPSNTWQVLVNIGNCYSQLGDYDKAKSYLMDSIDAGGLHPTQCVNLAAIYEKIGDHKNAVSWLKAACVLDPEQAEDPKIQAAITKLQDPLKYPSGSAHTPDYFSSLVSIRKWRKVDLPLRVYVRKNIQIPEFYEEFASIVKDSIDQWCAATGGILSYKIVTTKDAANVVCDYTDHRELLDPGHELGIEASTETRVRMDDSATDWADMVVLVKDRQGAPTFRNRAFLTHTCLHELGHTMGMHGHSPSNQDVMFAAATISGADKLSERDKSTIRRIYH